MPSRIAPPPVSTMPELSDLLVAGPADLVPHQVEDLLGPRLEDLRQDAPRHHARLRPPTLATSMVSSSSTIAESAQPHFRLIFSASGIGVRRPTAMSLVK